MPKFDPNAPFSTIYGSGKPKFKQDGVLYNKNGKVVTEKQLGAEIHLPKVTKPGSLQMRAAIPINEQEIQDAINQGIEDALTILEEDIAEQEKAAEEGIAEQEKAAEEKAVEVVKVAEEKAAEIVDVAEEKAAEIIKAAKQSDKKAGKKVSEKEDPLAD